MAEPLKIGVLLSGSGTNLQAIIDAVDEDGLPVDIVKVVSSRPDAYGIERAQRAGIPVLVMNRQKYADVEAADAQIVEALREAGFDVMKAENMELLTVRGYTDELWRRYARGPQVFVRQATQSTVRVVRKRE